MKLNIMDRVTLLGLLPAEGDFTTLKTITQLRESLLPSANEVEDCEIVEAGGKITWNDKGKEDVEIVINKLGSSLVVAELQKLNDEKKLRLDHVSLWEKFIEEK